VTRPRTGFPYLDEPRGVLAFAHRGGAFHPAIEGLENSLAAFRHAVELGYRYLETDVHVTRDGVLMAFHDRVLDRVTDGTGEVARLSRDEIRAARIGGSEDVPTLGDLLDAFPGVRFNIDIKAPGAVQPLADLVAARGAWDRILVGSFSPRSLSRFRALTGGRVATGAHPPEAATYAGLPSGRLAATLVRGGPVALQVPHRRGRVPVVTRGLVRRAHAAGLHVHVWTIDDPAQMHELLDLGVDGLMTDRTDILRDVLVQRGQWEDWHG
jgi:glycerophosphoryl diester phosphodiesterase